MTWQPSAEQVSVGADAILQIAEMSLDGKEQPNWLIARAVLEAAGESIYQQGRDDLSEEIFFDVKQIKEEYS